MHDTRTHGEESELGLSPMGSDDSVDVDEALENRSPIEREDTKHQRRRGREYGWIVIATSILVFLVNIVSPPRLMDDVDAVQASIARNMLESGDWTTAPGDDTNDGLTPPSSTG